MVTIGDRLAQERIRKKLTVEQVAKATKIRAEFINALENGNYAVLPSSAYAQGFVKNYIAYLDLPAKELMALFRREFNEKEYLGVLPEGFTKGGNIPLRRLRVRETIFIVVGLALLLIGFVLYQYREAFFSPNVTITSPSEKAVINSQSVTVAGTTEPNAIVTVNDLPAYVDSSGHFRKDLTVFSGSTVITIKVVNNFGKITTIQRHIQVKGGQ